MKIEETLASDEVEKLRMILSSDEKNAEEEFRNFRKKSLPWRSDWLTQVG